MVNAGTILAQTPFGEENNENVIAEEKQHNSDLLISRIQSEVNVVVDNVWKELNDKVFSRTFSLTRSYVTKTKYAHYFFAKKLYQKQQDHISIN